VPKVGQNGTDFCLKLKVKLGIEDGRTVAQSYEIVRNFNNFKAFVMFAVKKIGSFVYFGRKIFNMLMLVRKIFFEYAYVSPENFFDLPPVDNIFGKNLYDLVKILGNVGQNMTTPHPPPPPPNVDGFATSLPAMQRSEPTA
jgi:hypothetical protein